MGSIIVKMEARMAAYKDFVIGANTNPYPMQSATWMIYKTKRLPLISNGLVEAAQ